MSLQYWWTEEEKAYFELSGKAILSKDTVILMEIVFQQIEEKRNKYLKEIEMLETQLENEKKAKKPNYRRKI